MKKRSNSPNPQLVPDKKKFQLISNCSIGEGTIIHNFVNLYGCQIGSHSMIGSHVEIQQGAIIGNSCRIQSHTFICDGVTIDDNVFVGHGVMFINDNHPSISKTLAKTWKRKKIYIKEGASIGTGAIILGGITIGRNAIIGAGSVVTKNVADNTTVIGTAAKQKL